MRSTLFLSSVFASGILAAPAAEAPAANATSLTPGAKAITVGAKWQIILSSTLNPSGGYVAPYDAQVWDLDLFNTDASTIQSLKSQGKTVMCYFSAGTSESGRNDLGGLSGSDYGAGLPDWPGENWLNLKSSRVWNVMQNRIAMAAEKGCDAIDPDNVGK
jgi:hypothetical protein